jgi:NO-binding membrane sensor protein with MHYT domain
MNEIVTTTYQLPYVALSFVISMIGAFVALTAATRIRQPDGRINVTNTLAAGLALGGIGVWSMHFIGMLALRLDVGTSYSIVETAISLVAAIGASALALGFVAKAPRQLPRLVGAGVLLGAGVVFMHYLGMFGMKFGGFIRWDYGVVLLSALIAIVAATAALWLAFNTRTYGLRAAAAVLMAVAVCAMHYTGMTAAEFVCTTADRSALPQGFGYVSSHSLSNLVVAAGLGMAVLIMIDQIFQRVSGDRSPGNAIRSGSR